MIKLHGLSKRFGAQVALDDVTFEVPRGEIFGFVGPNGAGKTTTIRILATLMGPDSGDAEVAGWSVTHHPSRVRTLVGYMPDFFGVYDRLTAVEYLEFYAGCHRVERHLRGKVAAQLLELVNLADRSEQQVDSLSRGQKQRLGLARCLVHDPSVLLLDEPASGLDPRARIELRELVRELARMGKTILISSHILPELEELCTWVGFIDAGRIAAVGPTALVREQTGTVRRFRLDLMPDGDGSAALAEKVLRALPHVVAVDLLPDHLEFTAGEHFLEDEAIAKLVKGKVRVRGFSALAGDLADAFMRLTGPGEGA